MSTEFLFLDPERDTQEWSYAWFMLAKKWGDIDARDALSGECWQYMGSDRRPEGIYHSFRHRCEPRTQQREYWGIKASSAYESDHLPPFVEPAPVATWAPTKCSVTLPKMDRVSAYDGPEFDERDCSGVFDGFQVTSDADPGL